VLDIGGCTLDPIKIPRASLARTIFLMAGLASETPAGAWFPEPVREMSIFAENYDFIVTLLLLDVVVCVPFEDEKERTSAIVSWRADISGGPLDVAPPLPLAARRRHPRDAVSHPHTTG
jgi:hypothetical protein